MSSQPQHFPCNPGSIFLRADGRQFVVTNNDQALAQELSAELAQKSMGPARRILEIR